VISVKKTITKAFLTTIPVMMGYIVLGIAFGMLLESKGFGVFYSFIMSVFIYAGSMQFVAIDLLATSASFLSGIMMTLLINARHIVYGLSMIQKFKKMGQLKPYMIFSLTDETYSLLVSPIPENVDEKKYMFFISFFDQCYWILGSVLGSLIGAVIQINTTGMDFAMTALFVVIVLEQFLSCEKHFYTYFGFGMSLISLFLFGANQFIIPSLLGMIFGLLLIYKGGYKNA
jgi:Predicted branched-chain amino acid permease (azaleucine resistance)